MDKRKVTMPKNKSELIAMLGQAFKAGCEWGFWIEHTVDIAYQEDLGAKWWVGELSQEEAADKMNKFIEGEGTVFE